MVIGMKREEFISKLLEQGFELWSIREDCKVYGRVTYKDGWTDIGTDAVDWEEWHVYKDKAIHIYGTNREVPGWSLCPYCGSWYQCNEEEEKFHEDCEPEVIHFD